MAAPISVGVQIEMREQRTDLRLAQRIRAAAGELRKRMNGAICDSGGMRGQSGGHAVL
jgi:hypothetical protein